MEPSFDSQQGPTDLIDGRHEVANAGVDERYREDNYESDELRSWGYQSLKIASFSPHERSSVDDAVVLRCQYRRATKEGKCPLKQR